MTDRPLSFQKGEPEPKKHSRAMIRRNTKPIKRGGRPKAKNAKRRKAEFARCYHSRERVRWVKALPCCYCMALSPLFVLSGRESHNAHTVTGGMGFKAGYETIVPLCPEHHRRYDQHVAPLDDEKVRESVQRFAATVEAKWQTYAATTAD